MNTRSVTLSERAYAVLVSAVWVYQSPDAWGLEADSAAWNQLRNLLADLLEELYVP